MIDLEAIRLEKTNAVFPEDFTLHALGEMRPYVTERVEIAVLVWRVCAEFLGDVEPIIEKPGQSMTETAEEYVRERAAEIESRTLSWISPFTGRRDYQAVVMQVLDEFALADDYLRIKANAQHMAFEV